LKNLFAYNKQFKPRDLNIKANLKPFYPDYIQALGSVDEFIKIPRPDDQFNNLGLKVQHNYIVFYIFSPFTKSDYENKILVI